MVQTNMNYVKQSEFPTILPPDFKQVFQNKFNQNSVGKSNIIKLRDENIITDRDMEIIKFLFTFTFATVEHIQMLFEVNQGDKTYSFDALRNRMDKLIKYRILNKFVLTRYEEDKVTKDTHPDALYIYCLDFGGRYLLEQYTNYDVYDWYSTVNMKASELVSKQLIIGTFYLKLLKNIGKDLNYVLTNKVFSVQKKSVHMPLTFGINVLGKTKYYVVDVMREGDFPVNAREKVQKLEMLLCSNAWRKYFHDSETPPVLFLVTEDDSWAYDIANLVDKSTELQNFRLTTDQRLTTKELHEPGTFIKYVAEDDSLVGIVAPSFNPENHR